MHMDTHCLGRMTLLSGYKAAAAQACVRWGAIRCAGKRLYRRTLSLCRSAHIDGDWCAGSAQLTVDVT